MTTTTRRLTACIADDEAIARGGLRRLLAAFDWVEVVGESASGPETLKVVERLTPDLLFLDIQMPGLLGTQIPGQLRHRPFVVFTTAHAQHAVTAFELGAVDYLLKPFGAARLAATMSRVHAALGEPSSVTAGDRLAETLAKGPLSRLFVRAGTAITPLPVAEVRYFEADGDYVVAHGAKGRHVLALSLGSLEERLDPRRFVRIHRTHLVNLDHVSAFRRHGKGGMVAELRDGTRLAVSRQRAQQLRRLGV